MSTKTRTVLMPSYMKEFACAGPACPDSCCVGWQVAIDAETYKRYKRVRDLELGPLLERHVNRARSSGSEAGYAKVKLLPDGRCPFLSDEGWCRIQQRLGEGYLSDTCAFYPRLIRQVDGGWEKSGTLSCPEVARLALLDPAPMAFERVEEPADTPLPIQRRLTTSGRAQAEQPQRYFWELRLFTLQALQERRYRLWERLILLGLFYAKAQEYQQAGRLHDLPQLIELYSGTLEGGSLRESLASLPVETNIQVQLAKGMADMRFLQGVSHGPFIELYSQALAGLECTAEAEAAAIADRYAAACRAYYEPFLAAHGHILEHYLVNYTFKELFPFSGTGSLFDAYVMLAVHFALLKLHLIGLAAFHQGLAPDLAVRLIQAFAKVVEHNRAYLSQTQDLLQRHGFTSMPYMSILIKN